MAQSNYLASLKGQFSPGKKGEIVSGRSQAGRGKLGSNVTPTRKNDKLSLGSKR